MIESALPSIAVSSSREPQPRSSTQSCPAVSDLSLFAEDFDAVLFDLDGVLTNTASIHAHAWKQVFDEFLHAWALRNGRPFVAFDEDSDYRRYVDGRPRHDGIAAFLQARGIDLQEEAPDAHALGHMKNRRFLERLEAVGVEPCHGAVALVRALRAQGIKTAVVSSSANCRAVLDAADIAALFDARVDGTDLVRMRLAGKPSPSSFLEAARRLGAEPARAVVFEDAIAGVAAARAGRFGLVIGVDPGGQASALHAAGADQVIETLGAVRVIEANATADAASTWSLDFEGFDPAAEGVREALCTLGNGYFATRGAASGARAGNALTPERIHYPGTYIAGGYNRLRSNIEGRVIENEDLVNFPNWLALAFRIGDSPWFDPATATLLAYHQRLDLRRGLLLRDIRFEDADGRRSTLRERRFVSMHDMHIAAISIEITAENWSAPVTVRSAIDGRVRNAGAGLYRRFANTHLVAAKHDFIAEDAMLLQVRTSQSDLRVALAARTQAFVDDIRCEAARRPIDDVLNVGQEFSIDLQQGRRLAIEKFAAIHTSRDRAISECTLAATQTLDRALSRSPRLDDELSRHALAWKHLWRHFDMRIHPASQARRDHERTQRIADGPGSSAPPGPYPAQKVSMLLRFNICHLLQAVSPNSVGLDIGVPARGWTGEAYQGHVFWDELFIFPFFNYRVPEISRSLLLYRYRRLPAARAAAKAAGFAGAMFPWQSGSDGREETQAMNLNPRSQRWVPDNSWLQRHVGSAIAWNTWQYFQATHDTEFLNLYGAELMLEIARFWASIARFDARRGRYDIGGVMGPDEFHDAYPGATAPGLRNNAYTNLMAVWVLWRTLGMLDRLPAIRRIELTSRLGISSEELERWDAVSRRMFIPFHDGGIISQFEGYDDLLEFDWAAYRTRYGNIQRLDLILESEGDSANRYKLSKQADVLMLFYLFSSEELAALFARLDYAFAPDMIPRNVAYYIDRTSHGSTLSRVVNAWVLARSDRQRSAQFFLEALQSDVGDIQQGTTAEGIHLGAMAGTVDLVQRVWTGIEIDDDVLRLNPELPPVVERFDMRLRYRGHSIDLQLTREALNLRADESQAPPIALRVGVEETTLASGENRSFSLEHASRQ